MYPGQMAIELRNAESEKRISEESRYENGTDPSTATATEHERGMATNHPHGAYCLSSGEQKRHFLTVSQVYELARCG